MAYRLPGERVRLDLAGPSVEVEPIRSWPLQRVGISLYAAYEAAKGPEAELSALAALYRFVAAEAQPIWDILDHHGPVPATDAGFLRLPHDLGLALCLEWLKTGSPKTSAVDEVIPPGELRDTLKAELRRKSPKAA